MITVIYILIYICVEITYKFNFEFNDNNMVAKIILTIIIIISGICFLIYMYLYTKEDNNIIIDKKINNTETKIHNKSFVIGVSIVAILSIAITIVYVLYVNNPSLKNKYEVVIEENIPKKIIVGEYKDYLILMDIKSTDNDKLVFKKYFYELSRKESLKIVYINFEKVEGQY